MTLNLKQFEDHPLTGKAVRYTARKNNKIVFLPVMREYQDFLQRERDADRGKPLAA